MSVIPFSVPPPSVIPGIVGESRAMREVSTLIRAAAASEITVLIEGETGTGKELVARAIADLGPRHDRPFVAINCGALPESLLDAELFGHRHGAFTGAAGDRRGLLEAGEGGTVFLDEITSMSDGFQAKLLRVLENAEIRPVGCNRVRRVDLRIVAASNQCLAGCVCAKQFRADLFYRLSVFPIRLPPLRERREDIPALVEHFLSASGRGGTTTVRGITAEALERLTRGAYPGNVRQLKNVLARAVVLAARRDVLALEHFPDEVEGRESEMVPATVLPVTTLLSRRREQAINSIERQTVCEALERHGYNLSRAAAALQLTRFGLRKRMRRLGLDLRRTIVSPPSTTALAVEIG